MGARGSVEEEEEEEEERKADVREAEMNERGSSFPVSVVSAVRLLSLSSSK